MRVPLRSRAHDPILVVSNIFAVDRWIAQQNWPVVQYTWILLHCFVAFRLTTFFFNCNLCIFAEIRHFKPFTHVSWIYDRLCVTINFSASQSTFEPHSSDGLLISGNILSLLRKSESYKKRQWWSSVTGLSTQLNHKLLSAKSWQSLVGHSLGRY